MSQQSYVKETQILRRVASDPECSWEYKKHALKRMAERNITAPDIEQVLIKGHVVLEEWKNDILWRVRGRDLDGREVEVVASVDEGEIKIKVVTVF